MRKRDWYTVITEVKYNGCTIKRHGDIYYWGKHYGTLDQIKTIIDEYIKLLQS